MYIYYRRTMHFGHAFTHVLLLCSSGELTSLNLGSCGLGPAEACLVGLLLCQARCTITTALDLSWNAEIGADGLKALAHSLAHARSPLRSLNLSGKAISFHALLQA